MCIRDRPAEVPRRTEISRQTGDIRNGKATPLQAAGLGPTWFAAWQVPARACHRRHSVMPANNIRARRNFALANATGDLSLRRTSRQAANLKREEIRTPGPHHLADGAQNAAPLLRSRGSLCAAQRQSTRVAPNNAAHATQQVPRQTILLIPVNKHALHNMKRRRAQTW